jgi:hypothetical protein
MAVRHSEVLPPHSWISGRQLHIRRPVLFSVDLRLRRPTSCALLLDRGISDELLQRLGIAAFAPRLQYLATVEPPAASAHAPSLQPVSPPPRVALPAVVPLRLGSSSFF